MTATNMCSILVVSGVVPPAETGQTKYGQAAIKKNSDLACFARQLLDSLTPKMVLYY